MTYEEQHLILVAQGMAARGDELTTERLWTILTDRHERYLFLHDKRVPFDSRYELESWVAASETSVGGAHEWFDLLWLVMQWQLNPALKAMETRFWSFMALHGGAVPISSGTENLVEQP